MMLLKGTKAWGLAALGIVLALLVYIFLPADCPESARRMAGVFVVAAWLWSLEVFPHFVTSLILIVVLILTLARPGGVLNYGPNGYETFLLPFASSVIILFFSEFMLARGLHRYRVDAYVARQLLSRVGSNPVFLLLGAMLTTAILSAWIANTAAAAIMLVLMKPVIEKFPSQAPFRKAVILGIAFSSNIGGVITPIGTPPNLIALGELRELFPDLNFLGWMAMALPLALLLLGFTAAVLIALFPLEKVGELPEVESQEPLTKEGARVLAIFGMTALLWCTRPVHGIPESVAGLIGCGLLFGLGYLEREDLGKINWDVLLLMWGGLALGKGVSESGLATYVTHLPLFQQSGLVLIALFCGLALIMSSFISNTATAALLLPIAIKVDMPHPLYLPLTVALSCSFSMALPVSTPPNALAFGTGNVSTREMVKAGLPVSVGALILVLLGYEVVLNWHFPN